MPNNNLNQSNVLQNGALPGNNSDSIDPGLAELQAAAKFGLGVVGAGQNALNNLWDFIKVPGDVASGKYSLDEITKLAPGYALGLASAGTPVGAATVPENSLGIFAGTKSLGASYRDLAKAQRLEQSGASPENILSNSGWFRGADSKWRYTIPDAEAKFNPEHIRQNQYMPEISSIVGEKNLTLDKLLNHPDLFSAYPELGSYSVRSMPSGNIFTHDAAHDPDTRTIYLTGKAPDAMLSNLLHETQHAVQHTEGFSPGGNTNEFLPENYLEQRKQYGEASTGLQRIIKAQHPDLTDNQMSHLRILLDGGRVDRLPFSSRNILDKLSPELRTLVQSVSDKGRELHNVNLNTLDSYRRLSGEVEARAVQEQLERRDWSTPVWQHEGYIPYEEQILKKPHRLVPVDHDPFVGVDQR